MATVTKLAAPSRSVTEPEHSRLGEALGVLLFVGAMALLLSLVSFHPADTSWSVSGPEGATHNWIGKVGATLADVLLQLFGLVAYLIPALAGFWAIRLFRGVKTTLSPGRVAGLLLLFIAVASLFSLFPEIPFHRDRIRPGGAVGFLVERWLEGGLNKLGTGLLMGATAFVGLMMATSFSPRRSFGGWLAETPIGRVGDWWSSVMARFGAGADEPLLTETPAPRRAVEAPVAPAPTARKTAPEPAPAEKPREKKSWFKSAPKPAPVVEVSEDAEKARNEQFVLDSLYNSSSLDSLGVVTPARPVARTAGVSDLDDDIELIFDSLEEGPASEPSGPLTFENSIESIRADLAPPVEEPPANESGKVYAFDTRRLAREAIARRNSGENTQFKRETPGSSSASAARPSSSTPRVPTPPKADPVVAKMVEGVSIVRRRETPAQGAPIPPIAQVAAPVQVPLAAPLPKYSLPALDMLEPAPPRLSQSDDELRDRARLLAEKCKEFNVVGDITEIEPGPVVTTFGFKPDPGVKYSRVVNLVDDLCLGLRAESIRIDRLPGKSTVGIEVPNAKREIIHFREIVENEKFQGTPSFLPVALGKTINGDPYVSDLVRMPHLLIAGSTGSGKSVMINTLICSILFKATANDVRMILVDPKRVELELYSGIPHLLTPIITEPKRAANALHWAVTEMENRYKQLASYGVRNIDGFNREICNSTDTARFPDGPPPKLPYIVIVIDELADLMMVASSDVETAITRLAQMARAVGIHLVVATQRPSVDVITGLIKANFPARISFRVSSKVDSRTILDTNGAEQLLGQGDMLFLPPGTSRLVRIHGSYVNEAEINRMVNFIKEQGEPQYDESIQLSEHEVEAAEAGVGERDELYDEAMRIIVTMGRASTSVLQRRLRIGYGRAAAILDMMEREGCVGPTEGSKPRIVKQSAYDYVEMLDGHRLSGTDPTDE